MGLFDWFHRNSNPGPPPQELGIMPLHYIPYGRFSEVKPRQTHLLLGWATTWDKTSILRFPAHGGPVGQNTTCKKVAHFSEETLGADGFFPKSSPSSGKLSFSVSAPEFPGSAKGPRPKGPENPLFCDFPPLGVRSTKTQNVKKVRTTIPDSVVGTPGAGKLCFSVFSPRP